MELHLKTKKVGDVLSDNKFNSKLYEISEKWSKLRENIKLIKKMDWAKHISIHDVKTSNNLYNFREDLREYIMNRCNICAKDVCSTCEAVGSKKISSDIDITIKSDINFIT